MNQKSSERFALHAALGWVCLFGTLLAASILICDGHLIYSLDDPYIHLAVAHNIVHGTFGINAGEPANPSSSILWPWLLALTEALGLGQAGPLVLSGASALGSVLVSARLFVRMKLVNPEVNAPIRVGLGLLAILASNSLALPLTGMEHSLHLFLTLLAFDTLLDAREGKRPSRGQMIGLIALPLIRFEGFALYLGTLASLFAFGFRRAVLVALVGVGGITSAYGAFMQHNGLRFVPGSILLKSITASSLVGFISPPLALVTNTLTNLTDPAAQLMWLIALTLSAYAYTHRADRGLCLVAFPLSGALLAQLVLGHFGWFGRYEAYAVALMFFALFFIFQEGLAVRITGTAAQRRFLGAALGIILCYASMDDAWSTPASARNIFEQQYQMRQFAQVFYRAPLAVNDLGLVSYGNPNYVLDLVGLGSTEILQLKMEHRFDVREVARVTDEKNVGLVMIYEDWFAKRIPPTWRKVAVLHNRSALSAAEAHVAFFLTPRGDRAKVQSALRQFSQSLPPQVTLALLF